MMRIQFNTDNSAFGEDNRSAQHEAGRILSEIGDNLRLGHNEGYIRDLNGNTIGKWTFNFEPPK